MQTQQHPTAPNKNPMRGMAKRKVTVVYQASVVLVGNNTCFYSSTVMGRAVVPVQEMATHLDALIAAQHPGLELVDWWVVA